MDKNFIPSEVEQKLYEFWEKNNFFINEKGEPYTILMPPPNANASLHAGHGMYSIDDVMMRFKILQGFNAKWIPGTDHAGIETQFVYEKHLAKQGKSRMDFDRETLYNNIFEFVQENSGLIYNQFKRLGFAADWKRSVYTLDDHVLQRVFETFKKMQKEGYVYKGNYMVNYCTRCGTSLAELEVKHDERKDPLYYVKYFFVDNSKEYITVATVRPEPIFVDTHLAVNPNDKKLKHLIGKKVHNPLTNAEMKIIGDEYVDPKFGTGIVKLTPAHDPHDFEVAKKMNLPVISAIDLNGRIMANGGKYAGKKVKIARAEVVQNLQESGHIEKIDNDYLHAVTVCYKCKSDLEPMVIPNWFIKVSELKKPVIKAVEDEKVSFHPKKYKKQILQWLEVMHDWPISRQNVWGIRIPVWYKIQKDALDLWVVWIDKEKKIQQGNIQNFLKERITLAEIKTGLQRVMTLGHTSNEFKVAVEDPTIVGNDAEQYIQETDTFDTWFSSGQWPLVTLKKEEYETRFPTDMLGTLSDILKFWVSRMIMFSLYLKNDIPFKNVYLWSMVADSKGQKMSKSKGNVINPLVLVEKYGADAFRAALLFGTSQGGQVNLSEDKIKGMRNFANKVWNIGRFIWMNKNEETRMNNESEILNQVQDDKKSWKKVLKELQKESKSVEKKYYQHMEKYRFAKGLELGHQFLWHRFADYYIEQLKDEMKNGNIEVLENLQNVYFANLRMLHPFMPFVTEAAWKVFHGEKSSILDIN